MTKSELTPSDVQAIRRMRRKGYAVIVWNPDELKDVDPGRIEELTIERGWEIIETLTGEKHEDA